MTPRAARVVGLAGWSGAGKTTLLLKLIPEFQRRGLSVSTLKHAHHAFEIDHPGKDSFEHRRAGAREVLIASGRRWALVRELREEPEPSLGTLLRRLSPVDLVVIEGFKASAHPKLEVFRAANQKPLLGSAAPNIRSIASDTALPGASVPVVPLSEIAAIADRLLAIAEPLPEVLAALEAAPAPARRARERRQGKP
ncbi:MAG: Molybdopterin-guanine dinucleotide biosynthesis protein MobB [uncultured Microvirga sp.]|uniref:Molybdopterin-guanine dinucleotide biosynthesis protein MobB n=1 Tax=uncultured Microvirga sp. TaxID=412392 RepID=A0A6J4KK46_9HYPH|nr:MAG: Molybdopterin-guanine dinucleotide biosynthesis protein MobB [uncultured Microvirga sp.]